MRLNGVARLRATVAALPGHQPPCVQLNEQASELERLGPAVKDQKCAASAISKQERHDHPDWVVGACTCTTSSVPHWAEKRTRRREKE